MSARIINGKQVSEAILSEVALGVQKLRKNNINPTLAVFRAGEDYGSISYEKCIRSTFAKVNIAVESFIYPEDVSEGIFIDAVNKANSDDDINGILVFEPLPFTMDREKIRSAIKPEKDIDGINPVNSGKLLDTDETAFAPCAAEAVIKLLKENKIELKEKNITIINNSTLFGKPLSLLLSNEFATVSICNKFTKDLKQYTMQSDIVITACGIYGIIKPDMLKAGSIVIDIAMAKTKENGKEIRTGDCSMSCIDADISIISATPGLGIGTGPITTAVLAKHLLKACILQNSLKY